MLNSFKEYEQKQQQLSEALKAEDYEAAIVIGWYKNNKKKFDLASSGITDSVYKVLQSNPAALKAGEDIAKAIAKKFGNKTAKAVQYGREKSALTAFWKSHGASSTTPKTDILVGNKRLSLKMGLAQLMSSGAEESRATLYAALNSTPKLKSDPKFKKVQKVFDSFVKSTLAPGKLRPIIKKGDNPVVNAAEKAHKQCMKELGLLFEKSPEFQIAFAREAMSGYEKFGKGDNAAAEFMVVATKDGKKVSIHTVDDDGYCTKIANKMKLQVRFKTSGQTLKVAVTKANPKGKTGKYNYWSVVSLIVDAMTASEKESLDEGILDVIKTKVKSIYFKVVSKVQNFIKDGITNFMTFLGIKPKVDVKREIYFD